ncbi:MAG: hypothetical protein WBO47_04925 [Gammaproteobacteria bacterium]
MLTVLQQVLTSLAILGLLISVVISYLKVNKLWARRHIKEVAESISVVAAILSLFTTLPFLIKFVVIDQDYVAAGKFLLSLLVFFVFFLVGIGYWVKRQENPGLWGLLRRAIANERGEISYLIHSFTKPREAPAILRILRLVSLVDQHLDARETEILQSVARPWGIHPEEFTNGQDVGDSADIGEVRQAFTDYLGLHPEHDQVEKVVDLIRFMIHADRQVTTDEAIVLDEVSGAASAYLSSKGARAEMYEVLLVPQRAEHFERVNELVTDPVLHPRAGGEAYVAGTYYSESFARAICRRFQRRDFFSTVERRQIDAVSEHAPSESRAGGSASKAEQTGQFR